MKKFLGLALLTAVTYLVGQAALAAEDPKAIIDKGIQALGGEDKLAKAKAVSWKAKGKIHFQGNANDFSSEATVEGLDRYQSKFAADFNGQKFEGTMVLAGDKGWRNFGGMGVNDLDADALANEKRSVYLQVIPITLLPLKDKAYKIESAKEDKVDTKPAVGVKVTGQDNKDFTIYFDKESGLPVKLVAKVIGLPELQAGEAKSRKSPASIASVGTYAYVCGGSWRVRVPW